MTTHSLENLIAITVECAKLNPGFETQLISANMLKIYRLAKTLHKRYENMEQFAWAQEGVYLKQTINLEDKCIVLAREIGLTAVVQRDPHVWPVILVVDHWKGREMGIG